MEFFEEIDKVKKDFPRLKTITNEALSYELNNYQKFAIVVYIICFAFGIVLGNLFPVCGNSSSFYLNCTLTTFNFSLMLFVWFVSLLVCLFFFAIGHIILLLTEISKKLDKRK